MYLLPKVRNRVWKSPGSILKRGCSSEQLEQIVPERAKEIVDKSIVGRRNTKKRPRVA